MTEKEIESLYKQIEGLSSSEIQQRVDKELAHQTSSNHILGSLIGIGLIVPNTPKVKASELERACKKSWIYNLSKIRDIINHNPKTSKSIMDIVVLLAPAIAQQYTGISGMAIVGALTIFCKQNLGL